MDGLGYALGLGLAVRNTDGPLPMSGLSVWYDAADRDSLWQDTAGTVPVTADGTPVALMRDKSGNGHHMVQTTVAARPLYRTSGGQSWLQFDGVDDLMTCATTPQTTPATLGLAFTHAGFTSGFANLFRSGGDMPRLYLAQTAPSHIRCFWGTGFLFVQRSQPLTELGMISAVALTTGTTGQLESGGVTASVATLTPGATTGGMTLGNPDFSGRLHRMACYARALDATAQTQLRTYLS